jgi:hypothetical protein
MAKKYYCQCINAETGKKIRCTLETNLPVRVNSCPNDRGFANWVEKKNLKIRLIWGTVNGKVKAEK